MEVSGRHFVPPALPLGKEPWYRQTGGSVVQTAGLYILEKKKKVSCPRCWNNMQPFVDIFVSNVK